MSDEHELRDLDAVLPEGQDEEAQGREPEQEPEGQYEDPADLTGFSEAPPRLDRKKVSTIVACFLSAIVLLGLVFGGGSPKKKQAAADPAWAANAPKDFLQRELNSALSNFSAEGPQEAEADLTAAEIPTDDEHGLPVVTAIDSRAVPAAVNYAPAAAQAPQQPAQRQPQLSSLVPKIEGSLFSSQQAPPQQAADPYAALLGGQAPNPYASLLGAGLERAGLTGLAQQDPYAAQNDQAGKAGFYSAASGGSIAGAFLQENLLWIGTVIPAVLETAINTDLPGNVIARVTQNVYDSQTGKNILIPQGTLLVAQYNSSVSYQQRRVQVVWDVLVRPDGYQVELEGMNSVDPRGIAGLKAVYHENWFEYVKAAGIVSLFSVINSRMVEEVANYGSSEMASGVITSNAEFIKDIGGNLISRALNIQPTLTVDSGEKINVILNKNIYLPPFKNFEVKQRYILK
jgi:type IV secretion system protein TrbI